MSDQYQGPTDGMTPEGHQLSNENAIRPLWSKWTEPTKPSEALKIGLDYAKIEGLWCKHTLITLRSIIKNKNKEYCGYSGSDSDYDFDPDDVDHLNALEEVEKDGLTCGDVSACSLGILVMSVLDGPAVHKHFHPNIKDYKRIEEYWMLLSTEDQLCQHPIGGPSVIFLYAGLSKAFREFVSISEDDGIEDPDTIIRHYLIQDYPNDVWSIDMRRKSQISKARNGIMGINDDETSFNGKDQHQMIISGFQYGREFALAHEAQIGFQ